MLRKVFLLAGLSCLLYGQEFRSTLTGRVTDSSGAVVPNVKIEAIKIDTNSKFQTTSGPEGMYTLPQLSPGVYEIRATGDGFKQYIQTGVKLETNERVGQDIQLQVGSATESITITADAAPLNTVSASSGQAITTYEVESLPVNGRAPMDLAFLAFGVISNETRDQERPFENGGLSNFAMGGTVTSKNELLLDGVPNLGTTSIGGGGRVAFSPPVDAVSEVKVEVLNVDASFGNTGGGTGNVTTKGGTNSLHGTLSEYNQTSALAATPFFINAAGTKKTVSRQNMPGGTVGGPVVLPKIYNGRDKLFFFFATERYYDSSPSPAILTVPTLDERKGDFSKLLALGSGYALYDPATAVNSAGKITRQPFANNIIPTSRINAVAAKLLNYYAQPNQTGKADGSNNYFANLTTTQTYYSYLGRMDFNISDRNKLTGRFNTSKWQQPNANYFSNASTGETAYRTIWGAMVDDVHMITPTLVSDVRFGFNRYRPNYLQNSIGFDPTTLGMPSYMASNSMRPVFPRVTFDTNANTYQALGDGHFVDQPLDTYQLFASATKIRGTHSVKFGADLRMQRYSSIDYANSTGTFTFDGTWVKQSSSASSPTFGGGMAALLLGLPTSGGYAMNAWTTYDERYSAFFVQDDWRVAPTLSVNLGLRWEYSAPTVERWNRQVTGFNATAVNNVSAQAKAAYAANTFAQLPAAYQIPVNQFQATGGLLFASDSTRTASSVPKNSFSPRVGISWTPQALHNRTVFRMGGGIFYYTYGIVTNPSTGYSYTNALVATNDSNLTPYATLGNPFPDGLKQPRGAADGVNTNLGQSISFSNTNFQNQYSLRGSFDVQHQLTRDTVVQLGYIGSHSVRLLVNQPLAYLPTQYLSKSPVRDQPVIDALSKTYTNPMAGLLPGSTLNGSTLSLGNLLRTYPEYTGVTLNNSNAGGSYFHQFAARLQRRLSNGLSFMMNFQHSRLMEQISYLNNGDPTLEKRVSSSDRPNRLTFAGTWEIPVGKGRHFLSNTNRLVNGVVGGWMFSPTLSLQSGTPIAWGNLIYFGGNLNWDPRNVSHVFDPSVFETNSGKQPSQNFRTFPTQFNNLRSDSTSNVNLTLTKSFRIRERFKITYRAESFNLFNRAQFSAPALDPAKTTAGVVTAQSNNPRIIQMALKISF